jgi:hypothetical protein
MESARMAAARRFSRPWFLLLAGALMTAAGCSVAPRQQLEECHRLSQTLRSENAQLKDQTLALRSQNQDFSERAVDDARRLAQLEESNQRLETSVQAYQDERSRLESAYKELCASLPTSVRPLSLNRPPGEGKEGRSESRTEPDQDPSVQRAEEPGGTGGDQPSDRRGKSAQGRDSWLPARSGSPPVDSPATLPPRGNP